MKIYNFREKKEEEENNLWLSLILSFTMSSIETCILCGNFGIDIRCWFGYKCHFSHGEKELGKVNAVTHNFKDDLAIRPFGSRFPVGGLDGKPGGRPGYCEVTPLSMAMVATFGASAIARKIINIDVALASVLIWKGGVNSK